ncbi:MAG: hypothetical protein Q8O93_01130 [bacterium]|nr:hypothetical protein [bacterium]
MSKNIDGIKKLNSSEIRKNREVVLNYIGETGAAAPKKRAVSRGLSFSRRIDGLTRSKSSAAGLNSLPAAANESRRPDKLKSAEKTSPEQERQKQKISENNRQEAEARLRARETKRRQEKIRQKEELENKKRLAEESKRLEKAKRLNEAKKLKLELKLAKRMAGEKKRIKRRQALKKIKKRLNHKFKESFYSVRKNFVFGLSALIIFLAILYLGLSAAVLRFSAGGGLAAEAADIFPVPAVISGRGVISYNEYKGLEGRYQSGGNYEQRRRDLAAWIILRNFRNKYGLGEKAEEKDLAEKFMADEELNQVGLSRIKKISALLAGRETMPEAAKYADKYEEAARFSAAEAVNKFGPEANQLTAGQVSGVITGADGYYIVERLIGTGGQSYNYLFVAARTFDQYLSEEAENSKIFILAN